MRYELCKYAVTAVLAALAVACGGGGGGSTDPVTPPVVPGSTVAKFLPADGKTLLFVGQDIDADNGYVNGTGQTPAGATVYTSLNALDGVYARNHGQREGAQDWNSVKVGYSNSALAVGLSLVGQLDQLVNGTTLDANLDKLIDELQSFNRPIFLRIGYEADGPWNSYDATLYKAGWAKIVARIRAKNANRIATVWQTVGFCDQTQSFGKLPTEAWYPGDNLVDWNAFSLFMALPGCPAKIQEIVDGFKAKGKPVLIAESAPVAYDIGDGTFNSTAQTVSPSSLQPRTGAQIWDEWFKPYFALIDKNKDVIRGVAYINQNWKAYAGWGCNAPDAQGVRFCPSTYWGDTRVEANATVKANWLTAVGSPQFLSTARPDLLSKLNGYVAGTGSTPKGAYRLAGKPASVPGIIEAEAYDRGGEGVGYHELTAANQGLIDPDMLWRTNESVDIVRFGATGPVTDGSDKFAVGYTQVGEWLEYTVNVTKTGTFNIEAAVASAGSGAGGAFELLVDGNKIGSTVSVPGTSSTVSFQSVSAGTVTFTTTGQRVLRINMLSAGAGGFVGHIDSISVGITQTPFSGAAAAISDTTSTVVQAESYDLGGESVAYHDATPGKNFPFVNLSARPDDDVELVDNGASNFSLGYTAVGEWLEYTVNVAQAGNYNVVFNTARAGGGGAGKLEISQNDGATVLGNAIFAACPGNAAPCDYNTYADLAPVTVSLAAGIQVIRVTFKDSAPGNVDKMTFTKQ